MNGSIVSIATVFIRSLQLVRCLVCWIIYRSRVIKYMSSNRSMLFLAEPLNSIENLQRELLKMQKERIKATLDPRKKTVAFCLTTNAYRGNLGNIIGKLRKKESYNVIILIGSVSGDDYEQQESVFYIPDYVPNSWSSLDFIDVSITVREFYNSKPSGKLVFFLHDIHDSATGFIENTTRVFCDFDYVFLSSRFLVERVKQQVSVGKQKYLIGAAKDKIICVIGGGYPRLDRNLEYFRKHKQTSKTLIFATTAIEGPDTSGLIAFPSYADRMIEAILNSFPEYELIFRPHPLTTNRQEVRDIARKYVVHPKFIYDDNAASYIENYAKSALMITDMSGTAYTYALTTLRPVVFFSPNEPEAMRKFGTYQYFIDREKVGYVAENVDEMLQKIKLLLVTRDEFSQRIREYRDSTIYNIGKSEDYFVDNFEYIIEDKKHPDWGYL